MKTYKWAELRAQAEAEGGGTIEPVPAGTYQATIKTAKVATTTTGKDQIKVKFAIVGGPYDTKPVFTQFVVSPENPVAMNIFFRHLGALGVDPADFADLNGVASALQGRTATIEVEVQDSGAYKGRNNVKDVKAPAEGNAPASTNPFASI